VCHTRQHCVLWIYFKANNSNKNSQHAAPPPPLRLRAPPATCACKQQRVHLDATVKTAQVPAEQNAEKKCLNRAWSHLSSTVCELQQHLLLDAAVTPSRCLRQTTH
jgi:hypothetical protein